MIAQTYPSVTDVPARMFALASYLLTKGIHSFINLDVGIEAQWFPEYGIDLGPAAGPLPANINALRTESGLYLRRFANGLVLVNPSATARTYAATAGLRLIEPHGGGALPADASTSGWGLRTLPITGPLTLGPDSAAVLVP